MSTFFHRPSSSARSGFTLIEIIIAIAIIAVLSTVGLSVYSQSQKLARDAKRKSDLLKIRDALILYYQDNKRFPTSSASNASASLSSRDATASAFWLDDKNGSSSISFNANYIDSMPVDPINDATYNYVYYSFGSGNLWGACSNNQYFRLNARLENTDDAQAYKKDPKNPCNVGGDLVADYGDTFMIIEKMQ